MMFQKILNKLDEDKSADQYCMIAGYKNGNALRKSLRENREFGSFQGLVNLVKELFPDDEKQLMAEYVKTLDPNKQTARNMLEYLSTNRLLDEMKTLLMQMNNCSNKESKEWAKFYKLQYNWQTEYYTLEKEEYLKNVRQLKPVTNEMKTFQILMECYYYYSKGNDKTAYEISQEIEMALNDIKNEYIRKSYHVKMNEVQSYVTLWVLNDPIKAREKAQYVINSDTGSTYKAFANYVIGCSYFFTSFDSSLSYFQNSQDIYKKICRDDAADSVNKYLVRLKIFWEKEVEQGEFLHLENELIYKVKNKVNIDLESLKNEIDNSIYYYLCGLKDDSIDMFLRSMIHFLKMGDSFFANLPKIELIKRGYNTDLLNDLISMHMPLT